MRTLRNSGICMVAVFTLVASGACSKKQAPERAAATGPAAPLAQKPAGQREALKDADITVAVQASLARDPGVHEKNIRVQTSDGIVELTGRARDLLTKRRATMLAEGVKGVRAVSDRVELDIEQRPDAELQKAVKDALLFNPATDSFEVDVKAAGGTITLSGHVQSWQEKQLSGRLAEGVRGVRKVDNQLHVQYGTARADSEIEQDIRSRYRWDRLLNDGLITVSVKDGAVTLKGVVGSAAERRRAYGAAWVNGTRSVSDSDLSVEWWAKDEDLRQNKFVAKSDPEIAQAIRDATALDPRVELANLNVSVSSGVATLRGSVHSPNARMAAEGLARNTVGVNGVQNELEVVPEKPVPDSQINSRVHNALLFDPTTDSYQIDVKTDAGVVTLTGKVDNAFERAQATQLAARINGVKRVENRLEVKYPEIPYVYNWYVSPYEPYVELWRYAPPTTAQSDAEIRRQIETELAWSPFVDADQVEVRVVAGRALLNGTVDSVSERSAATENAFEGGAIAVENRLQVKAPGS